MARVLGAVAGGMAWLGWLTVCPALGFPTLATAGMLSRVVVPREDPGSWLGWALLFIGLASAALLYLAVTGRSRLRPSIVSGAVYGAIGWLIAGAVVMPLLGLALPAPTGPAPPPGLNPPDPMRGSFMMIHLGLGAPIAALVAWLIFGVLLGATAAWGAREPAPQGTPATRPEHGPRLLHAALLGVAVVTVALFASGLMADQPSAAQTATATGLRTLSTGPVQALPEGATFVSVTALPQSSGATFGPHAHVPGFACSLNGIATMTFEGGRATRVAPGEAGFMGAQEPHAHVNADDRVPAAAAALLIVGLAGIVALLASGSAGRGGRLLMAALGLLIAAGAIATWNPWSNDWLFFSIRPVAARGAPMPLPTASRVYESTDLGALPQGPYVETIDQITVAAGGTLDVQTTGAASLLVLEGRVNVQPLDGTTIQLGRRGGTLVPVGALVRLSNAGDRAAQLLKFEVGPSGG